MLLEIGPNNHMLRVFLIFKVKSKICSTRLIFLIIHKTVGVLNLSEAIQFVSNLK